MFPLSIDLPDGTPIRVREVAPQDRDLLDEALHRVSPETLRLRFHSSGFRPSDAQLDYLTDVDQRDHLAVGAVADTGEGEVGVGVARCIRHRTRPHEAELAVTVTDAFQHRGVGAVLVGALAARAEAAGIHVFLAIVAADRRPLIRTLLALGGRLRSCADGVAEVELPIRAAAVVAAPSSSGRLFRESLRRAA